MEETQAVETPEETQETEEISDLRADLNAAIDEVGAEDAENDGGDAEAENDQVKSPDTTTEPPEELGQSLEEHKPQDREQEDSTTTTPKSDVKTDKPPVNWNAQEREAWGDVPEVAKKAIAAREREVAMTMQQTADARRVAKQFSETMGKYRAPLQGMGFSDPFSAVGTIMDAAAAMRTGTMQQRAEATAKIIKDFEIDIGALDNALAGEVDPSPVNEVEALLDQRLAPVNELMAQIQQQKEAKAYQANTVANTEVSNFMADKEFASDVRLDMADILDLSAARGRQMSLQQAYDQACQLNPQVAQVLKTRQQQEATAKRAAASSVSGTPAGSGGAPKMDSIADALNAAWDAHAR